MMKLVRAGLSFVLGFVVLGFCNWSIHHLFSGLCAEIVEDGLAAGVLVAILCLLGVYDDPKRRP